MTLQGKRIVVLGGSFGIGLAVAQAASCEGVVVASSQRVRVDWTQERLSGSAALIR